MRLMTVRVALIVSCGLAASAWGQVSSNASLKGVYYFRSTQLPVASKATVTQYGSMTFDGVGAVAIAGQTLTGTASASAYTGTATYTVKPGGYATITQQGAAPLNVRLCVGALVGSSTEAGQDTYDMFLAVPAASATSNATLTGAYWISTLEAPNGIEGNLRSANFKLSSGGQGSFGELSIAGQARNLGNRYQTQTIGAMSYTVASDGTGSVSFPLAPTLDSTTQITAGVKAIYVAGDGSFFFGGSTGAGQHGMVVGVRAFGSGGSNASLNGLYYFNTLRYDNALGAGSARLSNALGGWNGLSVGAVIGQRYKASDASAPMRGASPRRRVCRWCPSAARRLRCT